jgi:exosortase
MQSEDVPLKDPFRRTRMQQGKVGSQHIRVIILASSAHFGRCSIGRRLPTALWPVAGRPAIERLVSHVAAQGVKNVTVCTSSHSSSLAQSIASCNGLRVDFFDELLPTGTAGCIRKAVDPETDELLIVFPANIVSPPNVETLVRAHREGQSDLTVLFNPGYGTQQPMGKAAEIYVCDVDILEHIPEDGYFDIKEGLIPVMLRAGKTVHAASLAKPAGNFRSRQEYLDAIGNHVQNPPQPDENLQSYQQTASQSVWAAEEVYIDPSARIYGPVVLLHGANISKDAVVLGPSIIGRNVTVGESSIVVNSALWDNARTGRRCQIRRTVIDYDTVVPHKTIADNKSVSLYDQGKLHRALGQAVLYVGSNVNRLQQASQHYVERWGIHAPIGVRVHGKLVIGWIATCLVLAAFLWSYWPDLVGIWRIWQRSDEYSCGLLVPFLAAYVLWTRRHDIAQYTIKPCIWGALAFVAAQALRLFGLVFMYSSAERLSIALSVGSLVLLVFGWQIFRKVFTVLIFLCLMLPWPNRIQAAVTLPLQRWATTSAVFCLETIGYEVLQEGNVIHIGQSSVAVAEACNGLRMITAFFVISGLVVLIVQRAWWEKLLLLVSSLPIALLCNTTRLTVTAIAFTVVSGEHWEEAFHDFGGYAMMPVALAAVVAELWILTKLTTSPAEPEAIIATRQTEQ